VTLPFYLFTANRGNKKTRSNHQVGGVQHYSDSAAGVDRLHDPAAASKGSSRTLTRAVASFPVSLHRVRTSRFAVLRVAVVALGLLPATTLCGPVWPPWPRSWGLTPRVRWRTSPGTACFDPLSSVDHPLATDAFTIPAYVS